MKDWFCISCLISVKGKLGTSTITSMKHFMIAKSRTGELMVHKGPDNVVHVDIVKPQFGHSVANISHRDIGGFPGHDDGEG